MLAIVIVGIVAVAAGGLAVYRNLAPSGGAASAPSVALTPPRFVEEASAAGVDHTYAGDYPYVVGGGVAAFDCDDDGMADLYLAGGDGPSSLYRNRSELGGALRFERVPDPTTDLTAVTGAYPLDIDGDRVTDLAVLRLGEDVVLRGLGQCRFERANEALSFAGGDGWTVGFSATWEDPAATLPTLAFGDYLALDSDGEPTSECADDRLVRPAGVAARPTARRSPCRRAGARCRCCSAIGIDPVAATCASRTTATTTAAARSSSGGSRPVSRLGSTRGTRAGGCFASGAWASPART